MALAGLAGRRTIAPEWGLVSMHGHMKKKVRRHVPCEEPKCLWFFCCLICCTCNHEALVRVVSFDRCRVCHPLVKGFHLRCCDMMPRCPLWLGLHTPPPSMYDVVVRIVCRPSGPSPSAPDCYDIEVEVPLQQQLPASAAAAPLLQKIVKQHDFSEVHHTTPSTTY